MFFCCGGKNTNNVGVPGFELDRPENGYDFPDSGSPGIQDFGKNEVDEAPIGSSAVRDIVDYFSTPDRAEKPKRHNREDFLPREFLVDTRSDDSSPFSPESAVKVDIAAADLSKVASGGITDCPHPPEGGLDKGKSELLTEVVNGCRDEIFPPKNDLDEVENMAMAGEADSVRSDPSPNLETSSKEEEVPLPASMDSESGVEDCLPGVAPKNGLQNMTLLEKETVKEASIPIYRKETGGTESLSPLEGTGARGPLVVSEDGSRPLSAALTEVPKTPSPPSYLEVDTKVLGGGEEEAVQVEKSCASEGGQPSEVGSSTVSVDQTESDKALGESLPPIASSAGQNETVVRTLKVGEILPDVGQSKPKDPTEGSQLSVSMSAVSVTSSETGDRRIEDQPQQRGRESHKSRTYKDNAKKDTKMQGRNSHGGHPSMSTPPLSNPSSKSGSRRRSSSPTSNDLGDTKIDVGGYDAFQQASPLARPTSLPKHTLSKPMPSPKQAMLSPLPARTGRGELMENLAERRARILAKKEAENAEKAKRSNAIRLSKTHPRNSQVVLNKNTVPELESSADVMEEQGVTMNGDAGKGGGFVSQQEKERNKARIGRVEKHATGLIPKGTPGGDRGVTKSFRKWDETQTTEIMDGGLEVTIFPAADGITSNGAKGRAAEPDNMLDAVTVDRRESKQDAILSTDNSYQPFEPGTLRSRTPPPDGRFVPGRKGQPGSTPTSRSQIRNRLVELGGIAVETGAAGDLARVGGGPPRHTSKMSQWYHPRTLRQDLSLANNIPSSRPRPVHTTMEPLLEEDLGANMVAPSPASRPPAKDELGNVLKIPASGMMEAYAVQARKNMNSKVTTAARIPRSWTEDDANRGGGFGGGYGVRSSPNIPPPLSVPTHARGQVGVGVTQIPRASSFDSKLEDTHSTAMSGFEPITPKHLMPMFSPGHFNRNMEWNASDGYSIISDSVISNNTGGYRASSAASVRAPSERSLSAPPPPRLNPGAMMAIERLRIDRGSVHFGYNPVRRSNNVFKAEINGDIRAAKVISLLGVERESIADIHNIFGAELLKLSKLKSPNVVKVYGAAMSPCDVILVSEFLEGGSLRDLLETSHVRKTLTNRTRVTIMLDVAMGMDHLYVNGMQHRQLRSPNVLLTHDWRAKVSGMGLLMTEDMILHCTEGNEGPSKDEVLLWDSRELLAGAGFSEKSDVYSYGIVVWEIMQSDGLLPYAGLLPNQVLGAKYTGQNPPIPPGCPIPITTLMERCWSNLPAERPSFEEISEFLSDAAFNDRWLLRRSPTNNVDSMSKGRL